MYSIGYIARSGLFGGLLNSILRAVIAIPLHVGTVRPRGTSLSEGAKCSDACAIGAWFSTDLYRDSIVVPT
jgi:hypothetical protein